MKYQSMLYKAEFIDFEIGWDYGTPIFESQIYPDVRGAMIELNFQEPAHSNWFATMRSILNDEIVEEELFDTSVIEIDYHGV